MKDEPADIQEGEDESSATSSSGFALAHDRKPNVDHHNPTPVSTFGRFKVDLLGHRHITTTQIYDKRRRSTSESASRDVPISRRSTGAKRTRIGTTSVSCAGPFSDTV